MAVSRPIKIAPGVSASCWRALQLHVENPGGQDWQTAIGIFKSRMVSRFIEPANALIEFEQNKPKKTFGFAVLALDCLVIETMQGFCCGVINHNGKSKKLFTEFLTSWDCFTACLPAGAEPQKLAERVYADCRCALLHSGATDGELRVGISGPAFTFAGGHVHTINRTTLHKNLVRTFEEYPTALLAPDRTELRKNFKKKMDAISRGIADDGSLHNRVAV